MRSRTLLINHVRSLVKASGARLPSCSADSFSKKVGPSIPEPLQPALLPLLDTIASFTQQIQAYDRQIETLCQAQYPETRSLQQVSGVGPLTALAFVLTLEDPSRFPKSRDLGPALGLVPRRDQSGDRDPQLGITKSGNAFLRRLPWTVRPGQAGRLRPLHPRTFRTRLPVPGTGVPCAAGVWSSPIAAARTPRSAPSSLSLENSPSCFTSCGRPARPMTPFIHPTEAESRSWPRDCRSSPSTGRYTD